MAEEYTHYRKAKPVILAATIIWGVIALYASNDPNLSTHWAEKQFKHLILEFAELFFFLFVAMTFVNSLTERRVLTLYVLGYQIINLVLRKFSGLPVS